MLVIQTVPNWDINVVPAVITRLVPAYQQYRITKWIKRIESSIWPAKVLGSQLSHMAML